MTPGEASPANKTDREAPRMSPRDRIAVIRRAMMRNRRMRLLLEIVQRYNGVGGGLLSAGLAFSALFAIVPALLALVALLGIVIDDPIRRGQIVQWVVDQVPPLQQVASTVLDTLVSGSRIGSVVGLVGVLWGASGFYGALDGALSLVFPGSGGRGVIEQRLRGMVGVLALVGMVVAAVVVDSVVGVAASIVHVPGIDLYRVAAPVVACAVGVVVTGVVYFVVPRNGPSLRAAFAPAFAAGIAIGLLTSLFGLVAPLLVSGFSALGVIASVFAALIWLNLVFQVLLYGATWASLRRDAERRLVLPPTL